MNATKLIPKKQNLKCKEHEYITSLCTWQYNSLQWEDLQTFRNDTNKNLDIFQSVLQKDKWEEHKSMNVNF